jgi:hypothetical protein
MGTKQLLGDIMILILQILLSFWAVICLLNCYAMHNKEQFEEVLANYPIFTYRSHLPILIIVGIMGFFAGGGLWFIPILTTALLSAYVQELTKED